MPVEERRSGRLFEEVGAPEDDAFAEKFGDALDDRRCETEIEYVGRIEMTRLQTRIRIESVAGQDVAVDALAIRVHLPGGKGAKRTGVAVASKG